MAKHARIDPQICEVQDQIRGSSVQSGVGRNHGEDVRRGRLLAVIDEQIQTFTRERVDASAVAPIRGPGGTPTTAPAIDW